MKLFNSNGFGENFCGFVFWFLHITTMPLYTNSKGSQSQDLNRIKRYRIFVTQMLTNHDSSRLRDLRLFLGKTQREMAAIAGVSRHTVESVEYGRLTLSPRLALKISKACGVDFNWLVNSDASEEIINDRGERYSLRDFEEAQDRDQVLAFWATMPEMELARAFEILLRVNREARSTPMGVPNLSRELAQFVERQVRKFPKLRDEVDHENTERDKRQKKRRPYLWPTSSESLKRARKKLNESIAAVADWERRYAARTESVTKND